MGCKYCNFKGYIIFDVLNLANKTGNKEVCICPKCKDIKAFSDYIKSEYARSAHLAEITVNEIPDNVIYVDFVNKRRIK